MAHAFPGSVKRSLIATAAVVALGTVGATCGVVVRGPADAQPGAKLSEATPVALRAPVHSESAPGRLPVAEMVK